MRLLALAASFMSAAWAQSSAPHDPASLAAELRRLEHAVQVGQTLDLPPEWSIEAAGAKYSISSEPLRDLLQKEPGSPKATAWLERLATRLDGFSAPLQKPNARANLDRILSRREFAGVAPPGPWQRFRDRVLAFFRRLLNRLFDIATEHPTGSAILFWLAISGGVGFLALTLFRLWTQDDPIRSLAPSSRFAAARTWQQWLLAARHAAEKGDAREAVHSAYWAAITRLQETGTLPTDVTHTPREYLDLAPAPDREPLHALTKNLERFWYAKRPASAEDFRDCIAHLQSLGCVLE